jgi:CheY-like chemotaxis protein
MNSAENPKPSGRAAEGEARRPATQSCPSDDASVEKTAPSILVVEDQEDVRRMMSTALELEGYRVDEAANALEGLSQLRRRRYHLVLTDYAMPGGTGIWMLREAVRQGLMGLTLAIVVTAHPDVRELANIVVIEKPVDLDYFLDQVRSILPAPNDAQLGDGAFESSR